MKRLWLCLCMAAVLPAGLLVAQEGEHYASRPTHGRLAKERHEGHLKAYTNNPDVLVLPGLVADRKARTVEVLAECTGLQGGAFAEFLLIDQGSSHGYEALLWSFAKPSDVHRALEFIGLNRGTSINPAVPRFWADGDRVMLSVQDEDGEWFPIEELVWDTETEQTLPEEGFVFSGSMMVNVQQGTPVYVADVYDPRSVASVYNERAAVLDVPRRVSQGDAYGKQVVNPERVREQGALVKVLMTPADDTDSPPLRDFVLAVEAAGGATGTVRRLIGTDGTVLCAAPEMTPVLKQLMTPSKEDAPYVTLSFGEGVSIAEVSKDCVLMALLETMGMVRVRPPADDRLYYRAFVPAKEWRAPEGRPAQPWEVHLARKDGKLICQMVWHEPVWTEAAHEPAFKRHVRKVADTASLERALAADAAARQKAGEAPPPSVLLIFSAPEVTYGELTKLLGPVVKTHGTIYVFCSE